MAASTHNGDGSQGKGQQAENRFVQLRGMNGEAGRARRDETAASVIPNGVDVSMFASGKKRPEFDDGRLNVLRVGRFDPRNGVDRVIGAWVRVRRAGTDARLILVGGIGR